MSPGERELSELTPDVFLCVGCGAQVSFEDETDPAKDSPMQRATCPYCGVVNDRALALLRKQQALARHAARVRLARLRQARLVASVTAFVLFGLALLAASNTHSHLGELYAQVERAKSQVVNVRERQASVVQRLANAEAGMEREAELSGAENRVRIERARYDEAATTYNAAAGTAWARICAAPFGLPERARLSSEGL